MGHKRKAEQQSQGQEQRQPASMKKARPATEFESRLYEACKRIPKGKVCTYGTLAKVLGSSARAVGQGMRRNPHAPVVPCHRVVASDLQLGGFSGSWGAETEQVKRKKAMLQEEGVSFQEAKVAPSSVIDAAELQGLCDAASVKTKCST